MLKQLTSPWRLLAIFAAGMLFLSGCQTPNETKTTALQIPVAVTTTTHLEDVVGIVAGDRVRVVGLVPRNGDPHTFEPSAQDVEEVAKSDAVFISGLGLEGWISKLVENAGGERPIFDTSQGLTVTTISHGFESGGERDPHVWMNPLKMVRVVENVAQGLSKLDPQGAPEFQKRAKNYQNQLRELDVWAANRLKSVPPAHRKLVTAHDAMGYFAQRYGFQVVGTVIPSVGTEAAETSAQQLASLRRKIEVLGVPAIFAERSNNPKFIEQIGADAKVRVVSGLYVDSLGPKGGEAGTYLQFFRTDVNKIAEVLR